MLRRDEVKRAVLETARAARREQTPAEKALWEMLRDSRLDSLTWRRQAVIGPFRADFLCVAAKLVVEVDGGIHDEPKTVKRDTERQAILERDFGLRVLRVSNENVLTRFQETKERIRKAATGL